jgi:nicotinamidase-related amidase
MENITHAAHLCVDMQNIFARGGVWETPWMERTLPTIEAVVSQYRERTIFSRFITPLHADDRPGQWRSYFRRWERATREHLRKNDLDLVPSLARYVPPALVVEKPAYSAFMQSKLHDLLLEKSVSTIVITGAETDVCVLATVLSAVDLGFKVVIVEDGLCSSSDEGHDALMTLYHQRYTEQIEVTDAATIMERWER